MATEEGTAKKAKHAPTSGQLASLLAELKGEALDLTVLAAIQAPESSRGSCRWGWGWGGAPTADNNNPHSETCRATIDKLFSEHVGKSPKDVVGNAIRIAEEELNREVDISSKMETGYDIGDEREKWLDHPQMRGIKGPRTDGHVWLAMFLGSERAEEGLGGTMKMDSEEFMDASEDEISKSEFSEAAVVRLLKSEVSRLSSLELLANILAYMREEARKGTSPSELLRFSVIYGLDGVMNDVLQGRYGVEEDLDIDALLALCDEPIDDERAFYCPWGQKMFMPAYAIAAILGHENVVVAALMRLGGTIDLPYGIQKKNDYDVEVYNHFLPSHVFNWVIMKNMPAMIKCLVNDCGFQFRWIDHEMHLPMIHERIFDYADYESFPRWTDIDADDLMWAGGSRARCALRAGAAYKKQMEMLDLLISLGFPMTLFFDTEKLDDLIDQEEKLIKEKKLESRDQCKAHMRGMDRDVRKARDTLYEACCVYNSMQRSESDEDEEDDEDDDDDEEKEAKNSKTLTLGDYYRKLKSQWGCQESAQADRLPEYEALDSRWRKTRRRDSSDEEYESDSYRDSNDGSSYGEPPGDW